MRKKQCTNSYRKMQRENDTGKETKKEIQKEEDSNENEVKQLRESRRFRGTYS